MGAFFATLIAVTILLVLVMGASVIMSALSDPTTAAAFEQAAAETTTAAEPALPAFVALVLCGGVVVSHLLWNVRVDTERYTLTTVGVRPRVTREAVHADEPCTVCAAPESHERTRAAKAIVVAGLVLWTYGGVTNYYCDRHAHRETLETAAAEPEPALASDGGTPLDDAADEIDTVTSIPQMLMMIPTVTFVLLVAAVVSLLGMEAP